MSSYSEVPATRYVVLVVEDEPMLRRVVAMTLRSEGFVVLENEDGETGLVTLRSDEPIDALLTDVKMPGISGYELAAEALSLRPGMPIALMTGFADEDVPESIRRASIPIIRKPFNFANLGASIRDIIGSRSG